MRGRKRGSGEGRKRGREGRKEKGGGKGEEEISKGGDRDWVCF